MPIEPPSEAIAPPPQPLKLTKKELKKLRTQRRQAREKEKQDLIRQAVCGLLLDAVQLQHILLWIYILNLFVLQARVAGGSQAQGQDRQSLPSSW